MQYSSFTVGIVQCASHALVYSLIHLAMARASHLVVAIQGDP